MKVAEALESEKDIYNQFVAAQESGSFLQGYEWGEWQASLGREVYRFKIVDEGEQTIGSIQLVRMPLPFGQYYLYAPYGPVFAGGKNFQFPISNFQSILNEIKSKFSNAVFIRFEPKFDISLIFNPKFLIKSPNIQPGKTLIIDLAKTEEELLAEMHHKTRYNIRLAQKHGVEIQKEFVVSAGNGLFFKEAVNLITETAARQGFKTFSKSYYYKLIDFFALHHKGEVKLHLYKAVFNKQLLSAAVMVDFGKVRTYLFGGSSREHKNIMAPYLLHFQAMLGAKGQGLEFYNFWGSETASGKTPGFVRFKFGFGGAEKAYAGAYDFVFSPGYYRIYKFLRSINRIIN